MSAPVVSRVIQAVGVVGLALVVINAFVGGGAVPDPALERAAEMARALNRAGVLTRLRHSAGQDVEGGCGQLRARESVKPVRVVRRGVEAQPATAS